MSRAEAWMPLYIGDYLGDTMALEAREHGAYLLLIMHYWRNGPLPDDDRALAGIARVERAIWYADTGPIVRGFFTARDGKLFHKRIERERDNAQAISDTKRAAAKKRWAKEKKPTVNGGGDPGPAAPDDDAHEYPYAAADGDAYASDVHVVCISPSPSPSPKEESKKGSELRSAPLPVAAAEVARDSAGQDVRRELFVEGLATIRQLTGRPDAASRRFLGKMLRTSQDNAALVLEAIREAADRKVAAPEPFIAAWVLPGRRMSKHEQIHASMGTKSLLTPAWDDDEGPPTLIGRLLQ